MATPETLVHAFSASPQDGKNMIHLELSLCESACMAETSPGRSQGVHGMDLEKAWENGPKTSNPQTTEVHEVHDSWSPGYLIFYKLSTCQAVEKEGPLQTRHICSTGTQN